MARRPRPQSTTAAGAVLLAAAMLAALPGAAAHGFMSQPASRNYIHSTFYPRTSAEKASIPESYWDYCPHCLAAGGPGRVSDDDRLIWPVGVNGFCGDMYYKDGVRPIVDPQRDHEAGGRFATEEVGGVYEEGSVLEIKVGITAHHNGRFGFRICRILAPGPGQTWAQAEKAQISEECFNQYVLVQANVTGAQFPYQMYSYLPFKPWQGYTYDSSAPTYSYYYIVPDGLRCDGVYARCVLQWHWVTGNSCTPPGTPNQYASSDLLGCGAGTAYPEEFWNCADIRTTPRQNTPSPPPSPPSPPPPPTSPPLPPSPPPPPSPPISVNPCAAKDRVCFCNWRQASGTFADTNGGCKGFFQCAVGVSAYTPCSSGLLFDESSQQCNYPASVACVGSGGGGVPAGPPLPGPPPIIASSPPPAAPRPPPPLSPPPRSPPPRLPPPLPSLPPPVGSPPIVDYYANYPAYYSPPPPPLRNRPSPMALIQRPRPVPQRPPPAPSQPRFTTVITGRRRRSH